MDARATISKLSLADASLSEASRAMARGYEGYFVPIRDDPAALARRIRGDQVDPLASFIFRLDGQPAGLLLVARRGRISRIAAVGFAPELRGSGRGEAALREAISAAADRGDLAVLLEVITENTAALALYEKLGFHRRRRLVGYRRQGAPSSDASELTLLPLEIATRRLTAWSDDDLPWQLAPESFSGALPPLQAFDCDGEAVVLVDASTSPVRLAALAVAPSARGRGLGRRLLAAAPALFPGQDLAIPAIVPESVAEGLLRATGWERTPLSQWEMVLPLKSEGTETSAAM
jgi:ribosomal protein S18 acetylase RimI-like enzyme